MTNGSGSANASMPTKATESLRDVLGELLAKADRISEKAKTVRENIIGARPEKDETKRSVLCMSEAIYAMHEVMCEAEDTLDSLLNAL